MNPQTYGEAPVFRIAKFQLGQSIHADEIADQAVIASCLSATMRRRRRAFGSSLMAPLPENVPPRSDPCAITQAGEADKGFGIISFDLEDVPPGCFRGVITFDTGKGTPEAAASSGRGVSDAGRCLSGAGRLRSGLPGKAQGAFPVFQQPRTHRIASRAAEMQ